MCMKCSIRRCCVRNSNIPLAAAGRILTGIYGILDEAAAAAAAADDGEEEAICRKALSTLHGIGNSYIS